MWVYIGNEKKMRNEKENKKIEKSESGQTSAYGSDSAVSGYFPSRRKK